MDARQTTTEVYEGIADEADAIRYFAITPETVRQPWADFQRSIPLPSALIDPQPPIA